MYSGRKATSSQAPQPAGALNGGAMDLVYNYSPWEELKKAPQNNTLRSSDEAEMKDVGHS